jgi:hypothetical protein
VAHSKGSPRRGSSTTTPGRRLTIADKAEPALRRLLLSGTPVHLAPAEAQVAVTSADSPRLWVKEELCAPLNAGLSSRYTGLVTTAAWAHPIRA